MKPLTDGTKSYKSTFRWTDVLIIRLIPKHVSKAVDTPGGIELDGIPQNGTDKVGVDQGFSPVVPRYESRHEEAHHGN